MSEGIDMFRLHCGCERCRSGTEHRDEVLAREEYNHIPMKPIRIDVVVPGPQYDRLKAIEQAALNLCKVKGRHHSEIAMQELMKACGVGK